MARWEVTPIVLTADERGTLEAWARATSIERRLVERAKIVLLAAAGVASRAIGRELGCRHHTVSKWRVRFGRERLAGLADAPRSGKPKTYGEDADRRILALLDRPPPTGFARWTAPLLARALGDISDQHVWRFLRAQRIDLAGRKSWCLSTDPEFAAKAADIVGLYLNPPDNAIVLAVDEKPAIQALERAQGYLKLPNGRALTGFAHEYKRRGTTTLFAALEVASGQIKTKHSKRRRRAEFLDFMNRVVADYPEQQIRGILAAFRQEIHSSPRPDSPGRLWAIGWLMTEVVRREMCAQGRVGDNAEGEDQWLLSPNELDEAIELLLKRFRSADRERIGDTPEPLSLMGGWMQAGDEAGVLEWVQEQEASDAKFLKLLAGCRSWSASSNRGFFIRYVAETWRSSLISTRR